MAPHARIQAAAVTALVADLAAARLVVGMGLRGLRQAGGSVQRWQGCGAAQVGHRLVHRGAAFARLHPRALQQVAAARIHVGKVLAHHDRVAGRVGAGAVDLLAQRLVAGASHHMLVAAGARLTGAEQKAGGGKRRHGRARPPHCSAMPQRPRRGAQCSVMSADTSTWCARAISRWRGTGPM